jgi:hypothetical protein
MHGIPRGRPARRRHLRLRNRTYRRVHEAETADRNRDDIPDVYQD